MHDSFLLVGPRMGERSNRSSVPGHEISNPDAGRRPACLLRARSLGLAIAIALCVLGLYSLIRGRKEGRKVGRRNG